MNIKASGRSALIMTAGFLLCLAGPMRVTESNARTVDPATKTESASSTAVVMTKTHVRKASRKSAKVAKAADINKSADDKKSDDTANADATSTTIPPSVANANAQLQTGDSAADSAAKNMSAQADSVLKSAQQNPPPADAAAAITETVAPDQLNEVDRQLSEENPAPTPTLAMAVTPSPTASNSDSTWGQTSLIGKVFLAFGGLLTLASAARMFMA